jgi:hypothetical protein
MINQRILRIEALMRYLSEEADFNRSWTDGRRDPGVHSESYNARRIELAEERERWVRDLDYLCARAAAPSGAGDEEDGR